MSTPTRVSIMSNAFKRNNGYSAGPGHYFPLLAEYSGSRANLLGSITPQAGPLLVITDEPQRPVRNATISLTLSTSSYNDIATGTTYGKKIYYRTLVTGTDVATTLTIPSGTRASKEFIITGLYNEVKSISSDDELSELRVYALGSNGTKLLYGLTSDGLFDDIDKLAKSFFVSAPKCRLCNGTGRYLLDTCPDCLGVGYVGFSAEEWMLEKKARYDLGVTYSTDVETQNRAWARKWWTFPNNENIVDYVAFFTNFETGFIDIVEHNSPECFFEVNMPMYIVDEGSALEEYSIDPIFINELLQNITPAGMSYVFKPYGGLKSETGTMVEDGATGAIYDYFPIEIDNDGCGFYGEWDSTDPYESGTFGTEFYDPSTGTTFQEYSGIAPLARFSGYWTGGVWNGAIQPGATFSGVTDVTHETAAATFFTGLSQANYNDIMYYDGFWGWNDDTEELKFGIGS